jgi:tripartite-type tricarboxylate transporter receptor subunit TctC
MTDGDDDDMIAWALPPEEQPLTRPRSRTMEYPRRAFLHLVGAAALPVFARVAEAQPIVLRRTRVLIPLAPGGAVDVYAKLVSDHMARTLHRTIVIEHKPGGSGNMGMQYVAHEPADGNLILVATQGMTEINPVAYADTRWSLADFIPLIRGVQAPLVLVTNPAIPAKTVEELIAWVHKNHGKLSYSSYGAGRSSHFLGFLFNQRFGLDLAHLPSKEGRAQAAELVANHTLFGFAQLQPTLSLIRDKKLNAIAVTSHERSRFFPDVPSFTELGQPDFTAEGWFGLMLRSGTPQAAADAVLAAAQAAHADPEVRAKLEAQGFDIPGETGAAFAAEIRSQTARWARLVAASGFHSEAGGGS